MLLLPAQFLWLIWGRCEGCCPSACPTPAQLRFDPPCDSGTQPTKGPVRSCSRLSPRPQMSPATAAGAGCFMDLGRPPGPTSAFLPIIRDAGVAQPCCLQNIPNMLSAPCLGSAWNILPSALPRTPSFSFFSSWLKRHLSRQDFHDPCLVPSCLLPCRALRASPDWRCIC